MRIKCTESIYTWCCNVIKGEEYEVVRFRKNLSDIGRYVLVLYDGHKYHDVYLNADKEKYFDQETLCLLFLQGEKEYENQND